MNCIMVENDSTEQLVHRARDGDRDAFEQLVGHYRARLERQIERRLGPAVRQKITPADVFQETISTALSSLPHFVWQGEASFYSWLGGIAEHIIRNASRKRSWDSLALEGEVRGTDPSPSRILMREERFERLQEAVRDLKPDQRQAVLLSRLDGLSVAEIAKRMNCTPNAVYKLLARALTELRNSMGDTGSLSLPDRSLEDRDHE